MVCTHKFEIMIDGISLEGEINFDHNNEASFKTITGEEMTLKQHGAVQAFLKDLCNLNCNCGEINKIEITKLV